MLENLCTHTKTYTVVNFVLDIVPGLDRNTVGVNGIGDGIAYERLRESEDSGDWTKTKTYLYLYRNLKITSLVVYVEIIDATDIADSCTLHIVKDSRLDGKKITYAELVGNTDMVLIYILDV